MDSFKKGLITASIPISYGGKPAGEILAVLHFSPNPIEGTPWEGFRYPSQVPEIETFLPPKVEKEFGGVGATMPEHTWATPGRLIVKLIELDDIKGKDNNLAAYVKLKLGKETTKYQKSKTYKPDQTGLDVKIDETFVMNLTDPNEIKQDDEIELEFMVRGRCLWR